jgi:UDP-N-acetylglucosamine 4,6-dehydratase
MNIIDAAIDCGVEKVIALSTDKAVNPINLYGASKLCSDKLFVAGNAYVGMRKEPIFSVVRYGNVAGSRGSVVPLWLNLIAEGATSLPITDERMTRFWITLQNAVNFVSECFSFMAGGEIFVPKIPSVKILDLAEAVAPELPPTIRGIRPGEKLHELMVSIDDARHTLEFDQYFAILPEVLAEKISQILKSKTGKAGKRLPEGFAYTSDTNTQWMSVEELRQWLQNYKKLL